MGPPEDFVAFILTHGRPDRVRTIKSLRNCGYTGPVYLVCDDEDATLARYQAEFGADKVLVFSKEEIAKTFDKAGEFGNRKAIVYARNASFELARQLGYRYFWQLDDDYGTFYWRGDEKGRPCDPEQPIKNLDAVLCAMLAYFKAIPALTIAMGQGGDYLGGSKSQTINKIRTKRKAMNTFICDVERPFSFPGRINEDVNAYVAMGRQGHLFLTLLEVSTTQTTTQASAGGMTELYLDAGTFVKTFYTIMMAPSCVKVSLLGNDHPRLHHAIKWERAVPRILSERFRKE